TSSPISTRSVTTRSDDPGVRPKRTPGGWAIALLRRHLDLDGDVAAQRVRDRAAAFGRLRQLLELGRGDAVEPLGGDLKFRRQHLHARVGLLTGHRADDLG